MRHIPFDRESYGLSNGICPVWCIAGWVEISVNEPPHHQNCKSGRHRGELPYLFSRSYHIFRESYPIFFHVFGHHARHGGCINMRHIPFDREFDGLSNDIYHLWCIAAWAEVFVREQEGVTLSFFKELPYLSRSYPRLTLSFLTKSTTAHATAAARI